ncbi:2OG-Fe(II) oxygenase [Alteromonas sp. 1_MG-2023]|uniref:2OG-Fe(II) oxygenase n=1 Tax=Alteromonas sp. 1_MG-2023 TaxID=3062669 RepID=UPI0026E14F79|nr:2OG-Fe(II) oxygenase [Alteromonas sp. 1_MG-2023]MDO6566130.1 2OG-Fe(II) oxygenase [Alteromonas sp. 1_MG-2023]
MENFPLDIRKPLHIFDESYFSNIVNDLYEKGFSIRALGVPSFIVDALVRCQDSLSKQAYQRAGIGRAEQFQHHEKVRSDEICWIDGTSEEGQLWLDWCEALRLYINRHLFMGLFSFESHFACYEPGNFYKRHLDAFQGQSNRKLSVVTYLNDKWQPSDGGELVLYSRKNDLEGIQVLPEKGTIAIFLSEVFPHEVLKANRERHSVAGWFRLNTSVNDNIDPP